MIAFTTGLLIALHASSQPAAGAGSALAASATSSAASSVVQSGAANSDLVKLAQAPAWPLVALQIAAAFRKPIAEFVGAIGGRINKLSVFSVQIELTAARPSSTTPLLDDIRAATCSAEVSDSARSMLEQAQSTAPADFSLVSLGVGTNG